MLIKPLPPTEPAAPRANANDHAGKGAWSMSDLEGMLRDCDEQPLWRDRGDRACAYCDNVDNEQLTPQQKYDWHRRGIDPRAIGLVGRVINGVLGHEAKNRRDPVLEADDDEFADVQDVLNVKLKEAHRETRADLNVSDAYASQVKAGIGWAEVRRNADPFKYQYAVDFIPRDQMWWDWRARQRDLSDARWLCRSKWEDLDVVLAAFPDKADIVRRSVDSWATFFNDGPIDEEITRGMADLDTNRWRSRTAEWRDGARKRIRMYHVQYKVPASVVVLTIGHRKIIVDPSNPLHAEAISRGIGRIERATTMQIRNAIYAGPFRLIDTPTTLKRWSYVPFFAFRRDADDTPFGLVEGMIAPQDDYNEASMRMRWMLKAQQIVVEEDALAGKYNTIADLADEARRPDMVLVLNKNRLNKAGDGVRIGNSMQLQKELFESRENSKLLIQDVPGVYGPQLGDAPTGVTSGIAMSTLVEQGVQAMGDLNDNYLLGRTLVFENLVDLITEDHAMKDMKVKVGMGEARRVVILNTIDPVTREARNVVKDAPVKLGLGEAPSSPAYQAQVAQLVGNMIRALAGTPHAALLIPSWVESNSMFGPNRKAIADDMRRATGLPTAGNRQASEQWQAQQQENVLKQQALQEAHAQAETAKTAAEVGQTQANTQKIVAETVKIGAEVAAGTAANEDDLIEASLQEALRKPQGELQAA